MKIMQNSIPSACNDAENSSKVEAIPSAHYIRNTMLVAGSFFTMMFLFSCQKEVKHSKEFIVSTSSNAFWSTDSVIDVDSFTMVSEKQMVIYINGRKQNLFATDFKITTNGN
jgi:predicted histidine transporter YuiF (NhaC family)